MHNFYCLGKETEEFIRFIICSISIASGLIVIILCIIPNLLERTTRQVIFFLAFNSISRDTLEILGLFVDGWLCIIVSYMKNIFLISSVIWSGFIAKTLNDVVTNRGEYQPKFFLYTLILSYFLVPLIELLPFITKSYESEICAGLKLDLIGLIWRNTLVYLPCLIIIAATVVFYFRMYKHFKSRGKIEFAGILIERGLLYSIIFIFIFVLLFSVRIIEYTDQSKEASCFRFTANIFIYLQGVIVLIVTLLRKDIKAKLFHQNPKRSESDESYLNFLIN